MKVATPKEMANIDRRTQEKYGLPSIVLMENAARGIFEILKDWKKDLLHIKILILCGKGNNGGDGIAIARHLSNAGTKVKIALLSRKRDLKGDPKTNLKVALASGIEMEEIVEKRDLKKIKLDLERTDLIVDGIFGTGFQGSAKGLSASAIELVNDSGVPVLSIDLPSGMNGETGTIEGPCIRANLTATLGLPKPGLFFSPGREAAGRVEVIDIGLPRKAIEEEGIRLNVMEEEEIRSLLPKRYPNSHKGKYGKVFCLAGSVGMTGAASLTALSSLRSGCGLVYLGLPESLNDIVEEKLTEVITKPLPETEGRSIALSALEEILSLLKQSDIFALGPGLSTHPETRSLLRRLIERIAIPTVIDADGLNNLSFDLTPLTMRKDQRDPTPFVLTPHPGEMSRLMDLPMEEVLRNRVEVARKASREFQSILVLKDAPTVIADPSGEVFINPTGNSGMSTAGSGDVLTGMIAGFLAQGLSPLDSARLGVFLHGLAGDIASEEKTEYGLIASDIMDAIPDAIKRLKNEKNI